MIGFACVYVGELYGVFADFRSFNFADMAGNVKLERMRFHVAARRRQLDFHRRFLTKIAGDNFKGSHRARRDRIQARIPVAFRRRVRRQHITEKLHTCLLAVFVQEGRYPIAAQRAVKGSHSAFTAISIGIQRKTSCNAAGIDAIHRQNHHRIPFRLTANIAADWIERSNVFHYVVRGKLNMHVAGGFHHRAHQIVRDSAFQNRL